MSEGIPHNADRKVALLIAVLALLLALSELGAKSAQTNAIAANIEASNLWAFFQAKTMRMTTVRTAAEALDLELQTTQDLQYQALQKKRVSDWRATADRYDNEPETQEGRRQLADRAKASEGKYTNLMARYHNYEIASVALQIAIVLASTAVVTGIAAFSVAAIGSGTLGVLLMLIAFIAPEAVHIF